MVQRITIPAKPFSTTLPQPAFSGEQSFVQRLIQAEVTLAPTNPNTNQPSTFQGTDLNTVILNASRMVCRVENNGAPGGSTGELVVYGLEPGLVNELSTLGIVINSIQFNSLTISAGNAQGGFSPVFQGTIRNAYPDYNLMPEVPFRLVCQSGLFNAVSSVPPSSFRGATHVATVMSGIARVMNVGFENNGITQKISNPYYPGNAWTQMRELAEHAHINAEVVDGFTKLAIWPIGGSRTSLTGNGPIPLISKNTGMIASPSFAPNGWLVVRMLFNPQVAFGGTIQIESENQPQANKTWVIYRLSYAIDTLAPFGEWEATAICYPLGAAAPVPPAGTGGG